MQKVIIIGGSGNIGLQTLELISQYNSEFILETLILHSNLDAGVDLYNKYKPNNIAFTSENITKKQVTEKFNSNINNVYLGVEDTLQLLEVDDHIVIFAASGVNSAPLLLQLLKYKNLIGLVNKEIVVSFGSIVMKSINNSKSTIIPLDSEHNAVWRTLDNNRNNIHKLLLVCSGSSLFHKTYDEIKDYTKEQVLNSSVWNMGNKITIDSATLVNKGLEFIEMSHLFNINHNKIEVVRHKEAILHGGVFFQDGSFSGCFYKPNMKTSILSVLNYNNIGLQYDTFNIMDLNNISFESIAEEKFKPIKLAQDALDAGTNYTIAYNRVNEHLVSDFLNDEILFGDIILYLEKFLAYLPPAKINSIDCGIEYIKEIDSMYNTTYPNWR